MHVTPPSAKHEIWRKGQYCSARLLRHPTPNRERCLGNLGYQEFGNICQKLGVLKKRGDLTSPYASSKHQSCRTVLPPPPNDGAKGEKSAYLSGNSTPSANCLGWRGVVL